MGMFDTFNLKEPLICYCGESLGDSFQTKDLTQDLMIMYEGENTVYNGLAREDISLSMFYGDEVEIEEDCNYCKGLTRFNVVFDKQGYWKVVPKEHKNFFGEWFNWKNNMWNMITYDLFD